MIEPIDPKLAGLLDSFTVPPLSEDFGERMAKLAMADPIMANEPKLPRLRGRRSRLLRLVIAGGGLLAASAVSMSAAAMGYLGEPLNHAVHHVPVVGRLIERIIPEHPHHLEDRSAPHPRFTRAVVHSAEIHTAPGASLVPMVQIPPPQLSPPTHPLPAPSPFSSHRLIYHPAMAHQLFMHPGKPHAIRLHAVTMDLGKTPTGSPQQKLGREDPGIRSEEHITPPVVQQHPSLAPEEKPRFASDRWRDLTPEERQQRREQRLLRQQQRREQGWGQFGQRQDGWRAGWRQSENSGFGNANNAGRENAAQDRRAIRQNEDRQGFAPERLNGSKRGQGWEMKRGPKPFAPAGTRHWHPRFQRRRG